MSTWTLLQIRTMWGGDAGMRRQAATLGVGNRRMPSSKCGPPIERSRDPDAGMTRKCGPARLPTTVSVDTQVGDFGMDSTIEHAAGMTPGCVGRMTKPAESIAAAAGLLGDTAR